MRRSKHFYLRKAHRYLGVILGIQFLFWTISGIYFSWSDIDEIHGDFEKKNATLLSANVKMVSPSVIIEQLKTKREVDSIVSIQLINFLGKPIYQIRYTSASGKSHDQHLPYTIQLAHAETGQLRPALSKEEAINLAKSRFNDEPDVKNVVYLERTNGHHEYRESPLPAYGITFNNAANTTVYVANELGTVQSFRNNKWRIFDFLWMTHTMDYDSRDDFSNILLRTFSVFGLITVISGFSLYIVSTRRFRKLKT